ncbi:glycerol-1-phosphate dehydrogenase [NAD(P)+] [Paenibacillus sp. UNCCL117]|uniref:sn-glycerol-1-phosphate dehydrogenase n=1 Tax=unclassified Paenibacillus TaxID=185978 RepID=UPI0008864DB6|nr:MULTISPECIES: sn-glycerol-1-phosphate dehydrogenase [unclassified Paenibacillus]SDD38121.1 glycerol-1-phosphate dehydrogenase [NAD(P)+] [Paenibacillus sp. cl123]SFW48646.1 glycerol-1-phosphate dehydrogenase [NAD(P)+] [Paenibacillus sp. UNCCL117]
MSLSLNEVVARLSEGMEQGGKGAFPDPLVVADGAIRQVPEYIAKRGFGNLSIAADANTYEAAGRELEAGLRERGVKVLTTIVLPNSQGDVVADEASVVQLLMDLQRNNSQAVVAAGAGTLHDIARYAAYTAGLPFISVPTAPSVDGFTSKGAPLLLRGDKITVPAIGPEAIFADLAILRLAPAALAAAGFGDMLGKYTSLFDWKFGSVTAGEPYRADVAEITEQALLACVRHAEDIGRGAEEGLRVLTEALIASGLAMLALGHSHPASGAEHHLSHYWEMAYLRSGHRQLLHGAKVGVACAEIAAHYHGLWSAGMFAGSPWREAVGRELARVPGDSVLRGLLRKAGGPSTLEELGVEEELFKRSLSEAHQVRLNRWTMLRAVNEG